MARTRRSKNTRRSQRPRRARRTNRNVLGGPNSTPSPAVTMRQTASFDLAATTPTAIGFPNAYAPLSLRIYAIPPRDTDTGTVGVTNDLAMIAVDVSAMLPSATTASSVQESRTVLKYNGQRKLLQTINFRRIFMAGLELPTQTVSSQVYTTPVTLTLHNDEGNAWVGSPISIYVVFEFAYRFTLASQIVSIPSAATSVNTAYIIDNDIKPSKLLSNNSASAYRARATGFRSRAVLQFSPTAEASLSVPLTHDTLPPRIEESNVIHSPSLSFFTAGAAEAHGSVC